MISASSDGSRKKGKAPVPPKVPNVKVEPKVSTVTLPEEGIQVETKVVAEEEDENGEVVVKVATKTQIDGETSSERGSEESSGDGEEVGEKKESVKVKESKEPENAVVASAKVEKSDDVAEVEHDDVTIEPSYVRHVEGHSASEGEEEVVVAEEVSKGEKEPLKNGEDSTKAESGEKEAAMKSNEQTVEITEDVLEKDNEVEVVASEDSIEGTADEVSEDLPSPPTAGFNKDETDDKSQQVETDTVGDTDEIIKDSSSESSVDEKATPVEENVTEIVENKTVDADSVGNSTEELEGVKETAVEIITEGKELVAEKNQVYNLSKEIEKDVYTIKKSASGSSMENSSSTSESSANNNNSKNLSNSSSFVEDVVYDTPSTPAYVKILQKEEERSKAEDQVESVPNDDA